MDRSSTRRSHGSAGSDDIFAVDARYRDMAGFQVNRVWPTARRKLIGPFVFFDHLQPTQLAAGEGLDVPPHPHIGLSTVTYLFSGAVLHRDSLGTEQLTRSGDLSWMTAGRGIVHSERTNVADRGRATMLHGIQTWVALPKPLEACDPAFAHYSSDALPVMQISGVALKLIAGQAFGLESPVRVTSPLFFIEAQFRAGANLAMPASLGQRAAYIVSGNITIDGARFAAGQLIVLPDDADFELSAASAAHVMLLGGTALAEDRLVWWNFVSSSEALLDAARVRWANGQFPEVPGESGQMPMPRA